MKRSSMIFICAGLFAAGTSAQVKFSDGVTFPNTYKKVTVDPVSCKDKRWQLVFEDEFNDTIPDASKWYFTPPWGSVFFFGDAGRSDSSQNGGVECSDPKGLVIRDGKLHLMIKKEKTVSRSSYDKRDTAIQPDGLQCKRTFDYYSGALYSRSSFGAGKFEIRCKLPRIDGVWPAFWLYGNCGQEFDIFEFLNERYSDDASQSSRTIHMTYHKEAECRNPKSWCSHGTTYSDTVDYSSGFHTFSVEWDAYQVTWKVDGQVKKVVYGLKKLRTNRYVDECNAKKGRSYRLYKVMPDPVIPVSIIVSCAVVNYGNGKNPLTRGTYPCEMVVEYVKAWTEVR
jgi:beta-glucanase (GH16 family)